MNDLATISAFSSIAAFEAAQRMAKALCSSPLVPKEYQGDQNIGSAIIALELAQRMNASPLMVMQNLDIIHGRPSWRAQMVIAAVNNSGRFSPLRYELSDLAAPRDIEYTEYVWSDQARRKLPVKRTVSLQDRTCRAYAYERGRSEPLYGAEVSIAMAVKEGWYAKDGSKWRTMPELMLRYRSASFWGRQYSPELLMGLPTSDELRDVIDVTAETVEPAHSEPSRVQAIAGKLALSNGEGINSKITQPAWPQEDADGWIDSRGMKFNEEIHGMSGKIPAVTAAGIFRMRRGCDPELHKRLENEALNHMHEPFDVPDEKQPIVDAPAGPDAASILRMAETAPLDDLTQLEDFARELTDDEDRANVEVVLNKRREQLTAEASS